MLKLLHAVLYFPKPSVPQLITGFRIFNPSPEINWASCWDVKVLEIANCVFMRFVNGKKNDTTQKNSFDLMMNGFKDIN